MTPRAAAQDMRRSEWYASRSGCAAAPTTVMPSMMSWDFLATVEICDDHPAAGNLTGDRPNGRAMTSPLSEGTLSCGTDAIALREGAQAIGSTFAREWDSDPAPRRAPRSPLSAETPTSLQALAVLATPSVAAMRAEIAIRHRQGPPPPRWRAPRGEERAARPGALLPWRSACAFALGATLAALAGAALERGALEVAALASALAGGITLAAALTHATVRVRAAARRARRD